MASTPIAPASFTPGGEVPEGEVEVRTRFDGRWSPGFEVVALERDTCTVRRRSDGVVLPTQFGVSEVRPRSRR